MSEEGAPRPRSCLVCHEPTTSEGQLCPECVAEGHRIENDTLIFNFEVELPEGWRW